jgi:hypothetical protein
VLVLVVPVLPVLMLKLIVSSSSYRCLPHRVVFVAITCRTCQALIVVAVSSSVEMVETERHRHPLGLLRVSETARVLVPEVAREWEMARVEIACRGR